MSSPLAAADDLDASDLAAVLQRQPDLPLHERLEGALRGMIRSGAIKPGVRIPAELELAAQLGLSRHTVRHALGVLSNEGLLRRERGRRGGTRVTADAQSRVIERGLNRFYAFAWEARARGAKQRSYLLERTTVRAGKLFAARLATRPTTALERIVRLRTADDEPLVLETAYLPRQLTVNVSNEVLERESIYDVLERLHGLRIERARESIRPVVLDGFVAKLLRAQTGSPAFSVERTTWASTGPIEWQESLVRGDRYLYSVDLPRTGL
jgi:GntR family transcriptional regulator